MASNANTTGADDTATAVEISKDTARVVRATGDDGGAALPHHNFLSRLYTGTGAFEVIGRRRLWYGISGAIVAIAIASIVLRGFTFGIDFKGGTTMLMPVAGATGTVTVSQHATQRRRRQQSNSKGDHVDARPQGRLGKAVAVEREPNSLKPNNQHEREAATAE